MVVALMRLNNEMCPFQPETFQSRFTFPSSTTSWATSCNCCLPLRVHLHCKVSPGFYQGLYVLWTSFACLAVGISCFNVKWAPTYGWTQNLGADSSPKPFSCFSANSLFLHQKSPTSLNTPGQHLNPTFYICSISAPLTWTTFEQKYHLGDPLSSMLLAGQVFIPVFWWTSSVRSVKSMIWGKVLKIRIPRRTSGRGGGLADNW